MREDDLMNTKEDILNMIEEEDVEQVYERSIDKNIIPFSISGAGKGNFNLPMFSVILKTWL